MLATGSCHGHDDESEVYDVDVDVVDEIPRKELSCLRFVPLEPLVTELLDWESQHFWLSWPLS